MLLVRVGFAMHPMTQILAEVKNQITACSSSTEFIIYKDEEHYCLSTTSSSPSPPLSTGSIVLVQSPHFDLIKLTKL